MGSGVAAPGSREPAGRRVADAASGEGPHGEGLLSLSQLRRLHAADREYSNPGSVSDTLDPNVACEGMLLLCNERFSEAGYKF